MVLGTMGSSSRINATDERWYTVVTMRAAIGAVLVCAVVLLATDGAWAFGTHTWVPTYLSSPLGETVRELMCNASYASLGDYSPACLVMRRASDDGQSFLVRTSTATDVWLWEARISSLYDEVDSTTAAAYSTYNSENILRDYDANTVLEQEQTDGLSL